MEIMRQNTQPTICSLCEIGKNLKICICKLNLPAICEKCEENHRKNGVFHYFFPIEQRESLEKVGISAVRHRLMYINEANFRLEENIRLIEACKTEIRMQCQRLISEIQQFEAIKMAELNEISVFLRDSFMISMRELEESLLNPSPVLRNELVRVISDYRCMEKEELLSVFDYKSRGNGRVDVEELVGVKWECRLSERLQIRPWTLLAPPQVALCYSDSLLLYYPLTNTGRTLQLQSPLPDPTRASLLFLPSNRLFMVGFKDADYRGKPDAYEIELFDGNLHKLTDLPTAFYGPGILLNGYFVYIFGGRHGNIQTHSYKYNIELKSFSSIAFMMNARYFFNPCLWNWEVYLIGGHSQNAEKFHIGKETYAPLRVRIEAVDQTLNCLDEDCIVTIEGNKGCRYDLTTDSVHEFPVSGGPFSSRCVPLVLSHSVYFTQAVELNGIDGVRIFDLQTLHLLSPIRHNKG